MEWRRLWLLVARKRSGDSRFLFRWEVETTLLFYHIWRWDILTRIVRLFIEGELTLGKPRWEYRTVLKRGQKVTLVHERWVRYTHEGNEWKLSHLALEIIDLDHQKVIGSESSLINTVY